MDDIREFTRTIVTHRDFFTGAGDIVLARAPGRLDVMGGIADYSGALVLELPLSNATMVAAQRVTEPSITMLSSRHRDPVTVLLQDLQDGEYDDAHTLLARHPEARWAAYVAGALVALRHERGLTLDRGIRMLIHSSVPSGKGVASSAALEVAAMQAIAALYEIELEGRDLSILCQIVENRVVGAPCGVMDQITSACGEQGKLMALRCQPAEIVAQIEIPGGLELWGIDSDVRHEIGGSDYRDVRIGAFMGLRIITELAGSDGWNGYLANVTPDEWTSRYRDHVPETMLGQDFLSRYGGISDTVTHVDPSRTYAVRQPAEHPIMEHARVREFKTLLDDGAQSEGDRAHLGALMYASHASYGACGLGSSGTDRLVALVRDGGASAGLYGAKITGGGSGGVVAVLARAGSRVVVEAVAKQYAEETGRHASVLGGSSDGAMQFGTRLLTR